MSQFIIEVSLLLIYLFHNLTNRCFVVPSLAPLTVCTTKCTLHQMVWMTHHQNLRESYLLTTTTAYIQISTQKVLQDHEPTRIPVTSSEPEHALIPVTSSEPEQTRSVVTPSEPERTHIPVTSSEPEQTHTLVKSADLALIQKPMS